jgi:hypothetical protein
VGVDGYRSLYRIERPWSRMVREHPPPPCATRFWASTHCMCLVAGASSSLARPSSAVASGPRAYGPRISSGRHRMLLPISMFLWAKMSHVPTYSIIFCEVVAIYGVVRATPIPIFSHPDCLTQRLSDNRDRVLLKARTHRREPALHEGEPFHRLVPTIITPESCAHTPIYTHPFRLCALLGRPDCGHLQFALRYLRGHHGLDGSFG